MTKELIVAIEIAHSDLSKMITKTLKDLSGVKLQTWTDNVGEKGTLAVRTIPDIIIIDDTPAAGELLSRVKTINANFSEASLLVISSNMDPQHIIDCMKAGASEYLTEPVKQNILTNAIEEVRARLANSGRLAQGRVYSFISAKGGVGSTVLAVNTAAAMAMENKSATALFDMSFQSGDASVLLDIVPQTTMVDISKNIHRLDVSFLRGAMSSHSTGINFMPAPQNPEESEDILAEHVKSVLGLAKKLYNQIIIDCSSMQINDCTLEIFKDSDKVFVVTDMSVPAIRNTVRLCKLMHKFGIGKEKVEIVLNRFIKGGALSLGEIEKSFDKPAYWLIPNDFSDVVSSINRGVPLVKLSPSAPFSKNVAMFIKKLIGVPDDKDFRGIRGTFGKAI